MRTLVDRFHKFVRYRHIPPTLWVTLQDLTGLREDTYMLDPNTREFEVD